LVETTTIKTKITTTKTAVRTTVDSNTHGDI